MPKGAKTLLAWSVCKGEDSMVENANGMTDPPAVAAATPNEPEPDEIKTDRPGFTGASTTVGKGRIQLESGYTFARDRSGGSQLSAHSYPEAMLRVGAFAEWFEFRLGQNFANERSRQPDGGVTATSGAEDLLLGMKLALTEQQKLMPELALVLQTTVPTGSRDYSSNEMLPGFTWLYAWNVVKDCLTIAGSTQANRAVGGSIDQGDATHSYVELAQSLTAQYTLTKQLGAYTEWYAFFPHSSLDPTIEAQHYLDGGFTYKFTPNTQYDIRAGFGLNRPADDFFVGTGFSFRY